MNKSDWQLKEKEFLEMRTKQEGHLVLVQNTLEEIEVFLEVVKAKIKTFK